MPPDPSLAALAKLRADPRLKDLGAHVPPLRLFAALGVARDEVAHSRLLATLLDPRTHAGAEAMLRALLARVPNTAEATVIRNLPTKWACITIRRELYRVDVIADILASNGGLVVGIENKIDAGEGGEQLNRYQDFLRDRFPGRTSVMLFLTPSGRLPLTAAPKHSVPCLAISYADVVVAVEAARSSATNRDASVLELVATHLREEIMGEPDAIRKAVRELWRDHPDALQRIAEHRPKISDIRETYESGITKNFGKVEFLYYPELRGELREIKFWVPGWWSVCPFTFMLYEDRGRLFARVFIWKKDYAAESKRLQRWAAAVNAQAPNLIDEDFKSLPSWSTWRRVFVEEDWPADAMLPVTDSDDETAQAAVTRMVKFADRLRPHTKPAK